MRIVWPASLFLIAATGAVSCSRTEQSDCGAIPRDFCAPFQELSASFSEQERSAVISLTTTPVRRTPAYDALVNRTHGILHLGRDDEVLTYLHQNRVDDNRRAYEAILCGYAWWSRSGSVAMDSLLQDGDGACWWVPKPLESPELPPPPRKVIDMPPPPPPVVPIPLAPSPPARLIPLGAKTTERPSSASASHPAQGSVVRRTA
jgi:hypothetical protein